MATFNKHYGNIIMQHLTNIMATFNKHYYATFNKHYGNI